MAFYPRLSGAGGQHRAVIDTFAGYNHNLKIRDGEFFDTQNLTTSHFPLLSSRDKRGRLDFTPAAYSTTATYAVGDYCTHDGKTYKCTTAINTAEAWTAAHWTEVTSVPGKLQAIIAKDKLYWVDNGTLYADGKATKLTGLQTVKETQLVSMGAYICIFPDKKYFNTQNPSDYGSMGANWSYQGSVTYTMCHLDGTIYTNVTKSATAPSNPSNGAIWIDTTEGSIKEWVAYTSTWTVVETVYTRLDFTTEGQVQAAFNELDGVNISGAYFPELNGSKVIYAVGRDASTHTDFIVLVGIQEAPHTQTSAHITITRKIPDMDFVCEAQNRLWGCYYGTDNGQSINEVYCCALGDFKNWEQYLGVSTDSWRASRGSDGPWTGCINYLGTPTFFKENVIHPVSVSTVGAHQIGDVPARGVQQGSHKSLAVVNETLYYKSRTGVMAYQGGMPVDVSQALGEEKYYEASAGVFGQRYYISMKDASDGWHLFCYDAGKGLWMHEDNLHAEGFTQMADELYCLADNGITAINGTDGTLEGGFDWSAVTGIIHYEQTVQGRGAQPIRYVSRYTIRLSMEPDSWLEMFIEYDSSGAWEHCGHYRLPNTGAVTVPVKPRRCEHFRIKLKGHGTVRLYSMARLLERGSDA